MLFPMRSSRVPGPRLPSVRLLCLRWPLADSNGADSENEGSTTLRRESLSSLGYLSCGPSVPHARLQGAEAEGAFQHGYGAIDVISECGVGLVIYNPGGHSEG